MKKPYTRKQQKSSKQKSRRKIKDLISHSSSQSYGFTLIELMVSIALFGIIGVTIMSLMLNALRGSNKTTAISAVRQNGDYALSQMARLIRPAAALTTSASCIPASGPLQSIQITGLDGNTIIYACGGGTISSNSASLLDTTSVQTGAICQFSCQQNSSADNPIVSIQFSLIPKISSTLAEKNVTPINFQTSILMRNTYK